MIPPIPPTQHQASSAVLLNNSNSSSSANTSWFVGAPFSKFLALMNVVIYGLVHAQQGSNTIQMDSNKVVRQQEYYRFLTSKLVFCTSLGEFVVGTMLVLVLARKFERELSSRKLVLLVVYTTTGAVLLESLLFFFFMAPRFSPSSSVPVEVFLKYNGPYALLGSLMWLYHRTTPRLYPRFFAIFGFTFSEKSFFYLWFAQIFGVSGRGSMIATTLGAIVCYMIFLPAFTLWEVPEFVISIFRPVAFALEAPPRVFAPMMANVAATAAAAAARGPGGRGAIPRAVHPISGGHHASGVTARRNIQHQQHQQQPAAVTPDPAALEQLISMGFERQKVMAALQATNNNVERAADRLLTGSSG